eukprot:SAG31_NODE_13000_length_900_cov_1.534332_2_plen_71_part_01
MCCSTSTAIYTITIYIQRVLESIVSADRGDAHAGTILRNNNIVKLVVVYDLAIIELLASRQDTMPWSRPLT